MPGNNRTFRRVVWLIVLVGIPIGLGYRGLRQKAIDRILISAVEEGDAVTVTSILRQGADVNSRKEPEDSLSPQQHLVALFYALCGRRYGEKITPSALMLAVSQNETEIALALLKRGADGVDDLVEVTDGGVLNGSGVVYKPLLVIAAGNGNPELVRALLDHGAKMDDLTRGGEASAETALLTVSYSTYLSVPAMHLTASDRQVRSARYLAVFQLLLDRGAWIQSWNAMYTSVLGSAVQNNQADEVALLLAHGADPNGPATWPTLHLAVENDNIGIVRALFAAGAKIAPLDTTHTPLYYTSDVTLMRLLVEHGANIEGHGYDSDEDFTPLMRSAGKNALSAVQFLLSHGADPNRRTNRGTTALMLAAQNANVDVVRYLLDHGAKIHARNAGGQSARGFSFQNQHPGVTALLENRGRGK